MIARVAAVASLAGAVILVVAAVARERCPTTRCAPNSRTAGGLVTGDDVLIGPARSARCKSIALTPTAKPR